MARIVDFKKVRETETEVEYAFGHPNLDRSLVIDKRTGRSRAIIGPEGSEYGGVVFKILRRREQENGWPNRGMLAT